MWEYWESAVPAKQKKTSSNEKTKSQKYTNKQQENQITKIHKQTQENQIKGNVQFENEVDYR